MRVEENTQTVSASVASREKFRVYESELSETEIFMWINET